MNTNEEVALAAKQITVFARSLGVRGVIVAINAGDDEFTFWRGEFAGPPFDVEGLARRLYNLCQRLIRNAELQVDRQLDAPPPAVGGAGAGGSGGEALEPAAVMDSTGNPSDQSAEPPAPGGEGASP